MENTPRQQIAADVLVATAILALGGVLVAAGRILAGNAAPGGGDGWFRIDSAAFDAAQQLSVDVLLGLVASLVGLAVIAWWLLSAALAISSALLAAAGAHRTALRTGAFAPAFMRRLALALLGISLIGAPAAHAQSLPDPAWQPSQEALAAIAPAPERSGGAPSLSGSRDLVSATSMASVAPPANEPTGPAAVPSTPTRPSTVAAPSSSPEVPAAPGPSSWVPSAMPVDAGPLGRPATRTVAVPEPVEVRPGDTLWSIVARHLGPGATDLEIADAWPAWYAANAREIGEDPDLIRPGLLLAPPA